MCESMTQLQLQGYSYLSGFLDKNNCAELTAELKKIVAEGKTTKDPQCPLSESVRNLPIFDSLLEQLLPNFEIASGKKLYPTYAYARLYAPGEELKIHRDRPSCEISVTLTLGFEGNPWPIFMGDEGGSNASKILMDVGDAVLYRGCDKYHWREPYKEGKWQAQIFLHYVDADGPHAEWKYDKRQKLAHHLNDVLYWHFLDAFSFEAAQRIISTAEVWDKEDAKVGGNSEGVVNKKVRDVKKIQLPAWNGIGAQMAGMALEANRQAWKFDVSYANQCDYLIYDIDGHYHAHTDTFMDPTQTECRKLTVLAFLNDDFEGGRLFLKVGKQKAYPPQGAGSVLVFPSFVLHGVEPVTKGVRRSVVTWMIGPWFK